MHYRENIGGWVALMKQEEERDGRKKEETPKEVKAGDLRHE